MGFIIFFVLWIITSVLTYGFFFAYYQREFPSVSEREKGYDRNHALIMSIFPFAGIIAVGLCGRYKHGIKFK